MDRIAWNNCNYTSPDIGKKLIVKTDYSLYEAFYIDNQYMVKVDSQNGLYQFLDKVLYWIEYPLTSVETEEVFLHGRC
jgi:hypothetical protein